MEKMDYLKTNEEGQLYIDFDSLELLLGSKTVFWLKNFLIGHDIEGMKVIVENNDVEIYIVDTCNYYIFKIDLSKQALHERLWKKTRISKFDIDNLVERGGIFIHEAIKFQD